MRRVLLDSRVTATSCPAAFDVLFRMDPRALVFVEHRLIDPIGLTTLDLRLRNPS
jgi:hypothetical protein